MLPKRPHDAMTILPLQTSLEPGTIGQLAERRLRESPYYFLRFLECRCEQGVVTLTGRVPHSQLRLFAESIVDRVEGVQRIVNRIEIQDPQQASA